MSETLASVLLGVLFSMVMVCVLLSWLFRRLRRDYPSTHEAIGSPSLFWDNSLRTNWLLMRFFFRSQWQGLGDSAVANVCRFMRIFLGAYLLIFVGSILVLIFGRT